MIYFIFFLYQLQLLIIPSIVENLLIHPNFFNSDVSRIFFKLPSFDLLSKIILPSNFNSFLIILANFEIEKCSLIPTLIVSKFARKHVKVVLTGDGADEILCGYTRYKDLDQKYRILNKISDIIL